MKKIILAAAMFGSVALLSGCSFGSSEADLRNLGNDNPQAKPLDPNSPIVIETPTNPTDPTNPEEKPVDPPPPVNHCDFGKSYTGFAGTVLEVGRVDNDLGIDQGRVKPFAALGTEYTRVLGNTPTLLTGADATFGNPVARWYVEPQANAVSLYTAYRIAFQGCLTATATDTKYASVPSNTTAATECSAWARKFWSRTPTQAEVDSCVKVAMVDTLKEGAPTATTTLPRRQWAYTCASVLTSAGFMTY
jgi:hypothetical protein